MSERIKPPGYYEKAKGYFDPTRVRTMENGVIKTFNVPPPREVPEIEEHPIVSMEELAGKREKAFNDKP